MNITFDPAKASSNQRKHGISFNEAATVFLDPLRGTEPDKEHSGLDDERFRTFGYSSRNRILQWFIMRKAIPFASLAHGLQSRIRYADMKTTEIQEAPLRTPLVRGKYSNRLAEGTNIAILDPALLDHFPDSQSVNAALHAFLSLPAETRAAALQHSTAKPHPAEDTFDPRVGTLQKAS